jgi:multidrug efflux pump subunit AcrA (membrane-fusion protein)
MAAVTFLENYYTFRKTTQIYGTIFHPRTPDQAALAQIEAELTQAHNQFLARQYNAAIQTYQTAQSLIYAQIHPGYLGNITNIIAFPFASELFQPLLSASLEWMNTLPVQQAVPSVRPRVDVNPSLLGRAGVLDRTGVISSQAVTPAAVNTVADWQMANSLESKGLSRSAQFFLSRASQSEPSLYKALTLNTSVTSTGAPADTAATGAVSSAGAANVASSVTVAPGLNFGEFSGTVQRTPLPASVVQSRTLGVLIENQPVQISWEVGQGAPIEAIQSSVFKSRISSTALPDVLLNPQLPSDLALSLPHDYYYVIPLAVAECYHALGDFARAEPLYFQAAAYQYLNAAIEAPYVWQRLATLYLDWGNSLFSGGDAPSALTVYQKVVTPAKGVPTSTLYTTASLKPGADQGRAVIAQLGNLGNITALGLNPVTAAVVVEVWQQLVKIAGGLDFWGFFAATVPIWTFDYLQSVAINFTQLAISAERDLINFLDRADQATMTQQQLGQAADQAQAEVGAAQLQATAAAAEATAYASAQTLANQRATDAQHNANDYATTSQNAILFSALQVQTGGGDDGDPNYLNNLANQLQANLGASDVSAATLSAANSLAASRYNRDYEVAALQRQANEMQTAATQAAAETAAARARVDAANAAVGVAQLRRQGAQQNLATFDSQTFTPDVWYRMGDEMRRIYRRYLTMALRAARLMQQAYNFETDQSLKIIKGDYSTDEVKGLLGADSLMADIQSFTYDLITSTAGKPQPLKQTISLAQQYAYLFETQFRKTGTMQFETRIDDFDAYYPGTYAGRIDAVEVEIDGIVPVTGISGALTNSGISSYRLPSSAIVAGGSGLKFRVQSKETLILSDYAVRQDALLSPQDQRQMRVFQGAGVASSWTLDVPKAINDIDFGALTDVRLTFYYKARFDPNLRASVLAQLNALPGFTGRQRSLPTRWIYPDAFFHFQDTGELDFTLRQRDFRSNETKPVITSIGLLVATDGTVPPGNLKVALTTPTKSATVGTTDAKGSIISDAGVWKPLASGTALGDYKLGMKAGDNPQLVKNGVLSLGPITNLVLMLGYTFTPKA